MSNIVDEILTVFLGTINGVSQSLSQGLAAVEDFFYVRLNGLSFVVFGSRQVGKTTLIHWLKANMRDITDFDPDPTGAGGVAVPDFQSRIPDEGHMKLKPTRDVGGEYAMWETDWVELFREAQPRGLIFMLDHGDVHLQKDALNFVLQMIEDEPEAAKNLRAFFVLVNKHDLWSEETSFDEIMHHYRNERRRLASLAERRGFKYAITYGSLETGKGVRPMMKAFFNTIRPASKPFTLHNDYS